MAIVEGSITLNELTLAEVDSDPSITGLDLPVGSLALLGDGVDGRVWVKKGSSSTDWEELAAANGIPPHATTHSPNGSDPLLTGSAVTLNANSTNTEGNANSFARSNHTHDLDTGVVSAQTPDQANAEGSSANLARADHVHNIPTAAAVTSATDGTNTQGNATTFARSNHTHKIELARLNAVANNSTSTTSSTFVLLPDMTFTPVAGTYLVMATFTATHNTNNGTVNGSVFSGGTLVTNTDVSLIRGAGQGNVSLTYAMNCVVTVAGSQDVEIRFSTPTGTVTVTGRSLTLLRVA